MYVYYNPNPLKKRVGDCVVRAVTKALDIDWDTAYDLLYTEGKKMCDMESSNVVWDALLRQNGFRRRILPNHLPTHYTIADFAKHHPAGDYVVGTGTHVVAVCDGDIYDSWDSSNEVPVFYWERS